MVRGARRTSASTRASPRSWPPAQAPSAGRWRTARGPGRRARRGWSPTSTTTCASCTAPASSRSSWCRSASCPTTWRSSTTSTPRPRPPPTSSACATGGSTTPGTHPDFVAMVRDLLLERAAVERGEDVDPPGARRPRRLARPVPVRLLPQPACRRCPRSAPPPPRHERGAAGARARRSGWRRRPSSARAVRTDGSTCRRPSPATPTSSPRSTRRASDSSGSGSSPPAPTTGSSARRATTSSAPPASTGSSTRSTARSTSSTASRRTRSRSRPARAGEVVAGHVVNIASGAEWGAVRGRGVVALRRRRAPQARRATGRPGRPRAGRDRLQLRPRGAGPAGRGDGPLPAAGA